MGSRVQASVQLRGKGSPKNKNNIKMGRGGQEVLKMDDIQAGSLLLEEISAPNPGEGDCRGIRYLCNLLDSVVTLAARKAKENGQKNILSEITGRDLGMQIGNPVPEANNNQSHRLTATIF